MSFHVILCHFKRKIDVIFCHLMNELLVVKLPSPRALFDQGIFGQICKEPSSREVKFGSGDVWGQHVRPTIQKWNICKSRPQIGRAHV